MLSFLGKEVEVVIDRAKGSLHPKYGWIYPINYGYLPNTKAGDGEPIDAYIVGIDYPLKYFVGQVVAIVKRVDDIEDKLIVAPKKFYFSKKELEELIYFQERFFNSYLIMK